MCSPEVTLHHHVQNSYHCRFQNEFVAPSPTAGILSTKTNGFSTKLEVNSAFLDMGCYDGWINDNVCDDVCRSEECEFDGDDCAEGNLCHSDSFCFGQIWMYRTFFSSLTGESIVYFCEELLPTFPYLEELLYMVSTRTKQECNELFPRFDFNKDGVLMLLILSLIG